MQENKRIKVIYTRTSTATFSPAQVNVIAAGGGNVIAAGGGNVIAAGGGNVIVPTRE